MPAGEIPNDESDVLLARRAREGDASALTILLERAAADLHAQIESRISSRHRGLFDADDVLQITFLEAFLRIDTLDVRGPGSFAAWVRRIADNNLIDAVREMERDKRPPPGRRVDYTGRDQSYAALVEQIAVITHTASRICAGEELRRGVDAALRELPADYETALRLFELEGLSGEEVAEKMGRSHGAVRMLLARGRERLAEVLGSDSRFFSHSA